MQQFERMTLDELIFELTRLRARRPTSSQQAVRIKDATEGGSVLDYLAVDIEDDNTVTISGYDWEG